MPAPPGEVTDVKIRVVSQKGVCVSGHKVGDEWIVGANTPLGICNAAYMALYPFIRVYQRGGEYSYPKGSNVTRLACPDGWNPVILELSRVSAGTRNVAPLPETCGHLEHLPYK